MLIEWSGDKPGNSQRCYEFLFDEFKRFYLSYMFPNAFTTNTNTNSRSHSVSSTTSSYSVALNVYSGIDLITLLNEQPMPTFERPILASIGSMTSNDERKLTQLHCKEEIIKWLIGKEKYRFCLNDEGKYLKTKIFLLGKEQSNGMYQKEKKRTFLNESN